MFKRILLSVIIGGCLMSSSGLKAEEHKSKDKTAIVLAMFGTTVEPALKGLINIQTRIAKKYPNTPVKIAFTSNIIRKIWQKRAKDPNYAKEHKEITPEILQVKGPLACIADLQDEGYNNIVVQPTHIAPAEEYLDLCSYINGLNSIKTIKKKFAPFKKLVVGRPALGTFGVEFPYEKDIEKAAEALAEDVKSAAKEDAILLYMGHGNDFFPSSGSYLQFQAVMQKMYPETPIYVGTVEGFPQLPYVIPLLKKTGKKKIILKPFMIVAGDHARNDMAGPEEDSWKNILEKEGFEVTPVINGLGESNTFADIYISHLEDAAKAAGINLK